jgi:hypothetical protein
VRSPEASRGITITFEYLWGIKSFALGSYQGTALAVPFRSKEDGFSHWLETALQSLFDSLKAT